MQAEVMPEGFGSVSIEKSQMEHAAMLMLQGYTQERVAAELQVTTVTLWRWRKRPEWRDVYATAQAEVIGSARVRLVGMVHKAIDKLEKLQEDSSGKGAPTEAAIAWGVLDRVGVEVQAQQAEGVRRILTRVPREVAPPAAPPTQQGAEQPTSIEEDRPAVRIVSKRLT